MLDRKYTKDQILERYLNTVFFGNNAYGIQAAAETYFGKTADQLTLHRGRVPRRPGALADRLRPDQQPRAQPGAASSRCSTGSSTTAYITADGGRPRSATDFVLPDRTQSIAGQRQRADVLHRGAAGLPPEQVEHPRHDVRRAVQHAVPRRPADPHHVQPHLPEPGRAARNVAARQRRRASMRRSSRSTPRPGRSGRWSAVAASCPTSSEVNMALQPRQTGSSIKLFVLAAALQAGAQPDDIIDGQNDCTFAVPGTSRPFVIKDAVSLAPATVAEMTWRSINCAYVRLAQIVGLNRMVDTDLPDGPVGVPVPGSAGRPSADRWSRSSASRPAPTRWRRSTWRRAPRRSPTAACTTSRTTSTASTPPTAGGSTPTPTPARRCWTRAWPWRRWTR